ncbi:MAG: hypothetical protein KDC24_12540, partial [Saprospiraceae bacterium]|nr:hypothetical protein [Saprospiraceae bacterium]
MDIQAYISSGILELYVLNQLEPEKVQEVEQNAAKYPAIKAKIDAIELALERYAMLHATTPPAGTLDNILKEVRNHPKASSGNKGANGGGNTWTWLLILGAFAGMAFFWYNWNKESNAKQEISRELEALKI